MDDYIHSDFYADVGEYIEWEEYIECEEDNAYDDEDNVYDEDNESEEEQEEDWWCPKGCSYYEQLCEECSNMSKHLQTISSRPLVLN